MLKLRVVIVVVLALWAAACNSAPPPSTEGTTLDPLVYPAECGSVNVPELVDPVLVLGSAGVGWKVVQDEDSVPVRRGEAAPTLMLVKTENLRCNRPWPAESEMTPIGPEPPASCLVDEDERLVDPLDGTDTDLVQGSKVEVWGWKGGSDLVIRTSEGKVGYVRQGDIVC